MNDPSPARARTMLVVLDGWGVAPPSKGNALAQARTPTIDALERTYFATPLQASGIAAGLPWGEVGNSEVGHMNMGAGRIVYQYLPRITNEVRDGSFFKNEAFLKAVAHVQRNNSRLHIMGLLTTGTVHASIDHLSGLLDLATRNNLREVIVHPFTDGKDSDPKAAGHLMPELTKKLQPFTYKRPGSILGRLYAMDRNNDWGLTQRAYRTLTQGTERPTEDPVKYLEENYRNGIADYDIEPVSVVQNGTPIPRIADNDAVIFFNFREDSARQLTKAFVLPDEEFTGFARTKLNNLLFVGMTEYEAGLPIVVAYPPPHITQSLAEVLSANAKRQLHVAETEKYAHVTYFFNGEQEQPFPGEDRILVPSRGAPHFENNPEMQAYEITRNVLERTDEYDFYLINFANADMLGHMGNVPVLLEGIEAVDACIASLKSACIQRGISLLITADHGNAEDMLEVHTGAVRTRHSGNPVPFYLVDERYRANNLTPLYDQEPSGILADIAPTILQLMGLPQPPEMTGSPLI
ncbi:MAG: 2,3-bisphosphoglycerate-independent phosphoglycerate mutase [Candidatus Spechtbacterales bacterium]